MAGGSGGKGGIRGDVAQVQLPPRAMRLLLPVLLFAVVLLADYAPAPVSPVASPEAPVRWENLQVLPDTLMGSVKALITLAEDEYSGATKQREFRRIEESRRETELYSG